MLYLISALLAGGLIALDQWVKWYVTVRIGVGGTPLSLIPHLIELTYAQNTGGAWSLLRQHTWLLAVVSAVVIAAILVVLALRKVRHPFGVLTLAVVLAGAAGNLIDRIRLGYVVDMFHTLFMDFPIFNVADICIVCGGIVFCLYFAFFYEKWEKKS